MQQTIQLAKRTALMAALPGYIVGLKRAARRCDTLDDLIDVASDYSFRSLSIRPKQVWSEIKGLLEVLSEQNLETVVEIGTAQGGSLFLFTSIASPKARIVSVDLPGGRFGAGYPWWKGLIYRSFAREQQDLSLIRGNSHDPEIKDQLLRSLGGRKVDFLFLDGDHSYDGVRSDYEMYHELVRPGGIIGFHDIVNGLERKVGGVPRFWQEVKEGRRHQEFVESWDQGGYGIGIIWVD